MYTKANCHQRITGVISITPILIQLNIALFCHFPSILNKRIKRKNSLQVSRAMDVELQILKHLARDAHPTVALIDEYCAEYQALFKDVRNYECFKYLHLGIISP